MHLVREVLDKQVIDPNHRKAGRVDGIVLELRPGAPPRVAFIEVGVLTAVARVSPAELVDLSDPERPRLRCRAGEIRRAA